MTHAHIESGSRFVHRRHERIYDYQSGARALAAAFIADINFNISEFSESPMRMKELLHAKVEMENFMKRLQNEDIGDLP